MRSGTRRTRVAKPAQKLEKGRGKQETAGNAVASEARASIPKEELVTQYQDMLLIRRFEERAGQLYGMGLIGGFCHLYIGQEAVVVGMQACLREKDSVRS